MFGIQRKSFNSPSINVYLFFFILITNQFLFAHSFRLMNNDQDQNELANLRQEAIRRLVVNHLAVPEESSSYDDNDLQSLLKPTVQRRFCCMSPLSGRKRFVRDLARQQIEKQQSSHLLAQ